MKRQESFVSIHSEQHADLAAPRGATAPAQR
eukprot:CAMPEP_0201135124 /NCGR_PEP_ID=MMETSP0850-20130426/53654_1 /ASSEMBLY_ACC=CAM_ASM_000622 /TAXON_ID=183588 /ORGANISM="Pseudo-nitzschia fraudulenta, Strain WWA7" /LENGTH=30 /DNA_ID= /DNA_START= /DNA_END= /DNA_ORIENTATION=